MGEIIDLNPGQRYAAWSTCYRREAGRTDLPAASSACQFNKLEMFVYTTPEDAPGEHLRLVALQGRCCKTSGSATA